MKQTLTLLGGFLGFAACFIAGMMAELDIGQTLFNASLGCLFGAFGFQWFGWLLMDCATTQRTRAKMNAQAAAAAVAKEIKK